MRTGLHVPRHALLGRRSACSSVASAAGRCTRALRPAEAPLPWSRRAAAASGRAAAAEADDSTSLVEQVRRALQSEAATLQATDEEQLVSACCVLLGALQLDKTAASATDVVRGLLRLTTLCGMGARDAARQALAAPELLYLPAERIVTTLLLLRCLFPSANLSRVVEQLPASVLLSDTAEAEMCAVGALAELRLLLPEALVQLLAEEEPELYFGGLTLVRLEQLRDTWDASGLAELSEAELARDMRNDRWTQAFVNRFVSMY